MNSTLQLCLSGLLGALAGAAAATLSTPQPAATATVASTPEPALDGRIKALEAAVERQSQALTELGMDLRTELRSLSRRPVESVAQEAPVSTPAVDAASPAPDSAASTDADDAATLFDQILAAGGMEASELWRRASELGLTEELIALFEARVESDPNDPALHVELGGAYLQKIQEVGQSPLAGVWATKADGAFDAALELDPDHWEARMSKAVSLSFWPPIFGKQKEAVAQFEELIQRQSTLPPTGSHAEPYVLLGNLHWQRGDTEAALAVWNDGLTKFPDSESLASKLEGGE